MPKAEKKPRYILVVDDNHFLASMFAKLLRHDGYEVRIAYDGEAALAMAQSFSFDAIILDIGLPGMNGYEVARALRRGRNASVHLIAVSGYGQKEDKEKALQAGFNYHLTKPVLAADVEKLF